VTVQRRLRIMIWARVLLAPAAACILPALAVLVIGSTPTTARADLVMSIENSSAPVGGAGAFDVLLVDTGGTFQVGGFSVDVMTMGSDITLTGASTSTMTASYIFGTLQFPPFVSLNTPTEVAAGDTDFTFPGYITLPTPPLSTETVGLVRITYAVDPSALPGMVPVSFVAAGTSLSDGNGSPIGYTLSDGMITISSVPEPMSLVSAVIGMTMVGAGFLLKARRRTT